MRVMLEPLMYQYGVDVFYNGHVHSYERCASLSFSVLPPAERHRLCAEDSVIVGHASSALHHPVAAAASLGASAVQAWHGVIEAH